MGVVKVGVVGRVPRGEGAIETSEGINDDAVKGATNPHRRERVKLCDRAALTKSQV